MGGGGAGEPIRHKVESEVPEDMRFILPITWGQEHNHHRVLMKMEGVQDAINHRISK